MHRIDNIYIRMFCCYLFNGFANMQKAFAKVFTAMSGDKNIFTVCQDITFGFQNLM